MKEIMLTRGFVALVDDEDYERLAQYKWHALKVGKRFYAARSAGSSAGRVMAYMHREIMNANGEEEVDHRRHFESEGFINNQRENLRLVSRLQNTHNRRKFNRASSSAYKGVSWNKQKAKWEAGLKYEGKRRYLGFFKIEVHAAYAYDLAAVGRFGEFALTNFPVPGSSNWTFGEAA